MARQLLLRLDGEVTAFDLALHDRKKLYGSRRRVVVDEEGRECARGLLSEDGSVLLPPGCTAQLYVDEAMDVVERADLRIVDGEGKPIPPTASTLGVEVELTAVPHTRLLDFVTPKVYALESAALGAKLSAALATGQVFETTFAYRDGSELSAMFLVQNEAGVWALLGRPTGFDWVRRGAPPPAVEQDDLFEDDLDFGML